METNLNISRPFIVREYCTDEALNLIKSVTLGSNGTQYQHQLVDERIKDLYKPLYLNLERNEKVLGNVTICRRPKNWYIRYFAFESKLQTTAQSPRSKGKNSFLKNTVNDYFEKILELDEVETLYAYIDPKNERSLWMSETFGFKTVAEIATQTFSRLYPKKQNGVEKVSVGDFIKEKIENHYRKQPFYFTKHTFNQAPFYVLKENNKIIAFAKVYKEEWKMDRLPGKYGKILVKALPHIPFLRRIINPKKHIFSVVDSVWINSDNPKNLQRLFEHILYEENTNSLIWWVDYKEPTYKSVQKKIKWGILHKITGVKEVNLVIKPKQKDFDKHISRPTYITAFDFI